MPRWDAPHGPLPTIGHFKRRGMTRFDITCGNLQCKHAGSVRISDIGMPEETVFVDLAKSSRFICTKCGGRKLLEVRPDWRGTEGRSTMRISETYGRGGELDRRFDDQAP